MHADALIVSTLLSATFQIKVEPLLLVTLNTKYLLPAFCLTL